MSTAILLITHDGLGADLLDTVRHVLGELPAGVAAMPVDSDTDTSELDRQAGDMVQRLDEGDGVLVLTDLVGSTPANLADRLASDPRVRAVTGLNLPMLVKTLNYHHLPLEELAIKAIEGGSDGILQVGG